MHLLSPFELAIRNRAAQITAYRFQLQNERSERRKLMAIEIKGLKADALTARANLDKLRAAYAKFNEAAPAHAADVEGLAATIGGMQSDLEFAATVMGNSDGGSEKLANGASETPIPDTRVALGPHPDQPEVATAPLSNGSAASTEPAA
jgi:hypothetical protein